MGRLPSHFDLRLRHATQAPSVTVRFGFWVSSGLVCGCGGTSWSMGAGCRGRKLAITSCHKAEKTKERGRRGQGVEVGMLKASKPWHGIKMQMGAGRGNEGFLWGKHAGGKRRAAWQDGYKGPCRRGRGRGYGCGYVHGKARANGLLAALLPLADLVPSAHPRPWGRRGGF